ncbi:Autophagy-related protein 27 [Trypanosoma melophagium]|uniref:Autophagy-related protein 27 n=1 Tax=Trypanosoma melophagium TaxID=715481 RepID=UPI00351AA321|nr:Autophagy-related protein 27 [Trypanosoma melophagium]
MLHMGITRAQVSSCIVNDYDLSVIPKTTLFVRLQGSTTMLNLTVLPCQGNEGQVIMYIQQSMIPTIMNLKAANFIQGDIQLTFSTIPSVSSTMVLTLKCGKTDKLAWATADYEVSYEHASGLDMYYATALTKAVCADSSSSRGCGGGCAFIIIFFVGLTMYIIVTVLGYFFLQGKRGRDLLPHPAFWADFPLLLKDGAVYVYRKVTACFGGGRRAATYEHVY